MYERVGELAHLKVRNVLIDRDLRSTALLCAGSCLCHERTCRLVNLPFTALDRPPLFQIGTPFCKTAIFHADESTKITTKVLRK